MIDLCLSHFVRKICAHSRCLCVIRKWFKHFKPSTVQLSGWDFRVEFGPGGRITVIGWTAIHKVLTVLESGIYGDSPDRWRHIFSPLFAVWLWQLMFL